MEKKLGKIQKEREEQVLGENVQGLEWISRSEPRTKVLKENINIENVQRNRRKGGSQIKKEIIQDYFYNKMGNPSRKRDNKVKKVVETNDQQFFDFNKKTKSVKL